MFTVFGTSVDTMISGKYIAHLFPSRVRFHLRNVFEPPVFVNTPSILDNRPAAEVLADLNDIDIENQAPINHIDDYMKTT